MQRSLPESELNKIWAFLLECGRYEDSELDEMTFEELQSAFNRAVFDENHTITDFI